MADIVIINPSFEVSFWGLQGGLLFFGKQANMPVGARGRVAAEIDPVELEGVLRDLTSAVD